MEKPICHDMFLDVKINMHRTMSTDEQVDSLVRDIIYAKKLGCKLIRCIGITPAETMRRAVPYAEKFGVVIALELHSPWNFESEGIKQYLEVMCKVDSPYLKIIPDCGIFFKRFPRVMSEKALRQGAQKKCVDYIVDLYDNHDALGVHFNRFALNS